MKIEQLVAQIRKKQSFLCVGLDTDLEKIPTHLLDHEDPIFSFNKAIVDATQSFCVAYKPNTAFYEAYGAAGWESLSKTIRYINEHYPEMFTIADAKRGDIGNTSTRYAKAFFEEMDFEFHLPYKKHIKGNFSIFQDIQNLKTPMDSSHQDD